MTVTSRRLNDGARALTANEQNLESMTLSALQALRDVVADGALAMQSLDDLGSAAANDAAWDGYFRIEAKLKRIDAEIARRKT